MTRWHAGLAAVCGTITIAGVAVSGAFRAPAPIEYRVLATTKTSTMEKELNDAAEQGYRFQTVMGGETAIALWKAASASLVSVISGAGPFARARRAA